MANQIIHIEQCGFLTTLQDSGCSGYLKYGISKGGAMDLWNSQLANMLIGNDLNDVTIEITQAPHRFRFLKDTLISFTGGGLQPEIENKTIPFYQPFVALAGSILELKQQIPGYRLYMAIAGGFAADIFLNSHATNLLIQTGGFKGRILKKEDVLSCINTPTGLQKKLMQVLKAGVEFKFNLELTNPESATIRVLKGVEWNYLTTDSQQKISSATFTIGQQSNRMGYRLKGDTLQTNQTSEIISSAVTQGTVQLTPAGELIVLMADSQTVGGYPRIVQVCATDLSLMAQKKPGDKIQFQIISLQKAEQLYVSLLQNLKTAEQTIQQLYAD